MADCMMSRPLSTRDVLTSYIRRWFTKCASSKAPKAEVEHYLCSDQNADWSCAVEYIMDFEKGSQAGGMGDKNLNIKMVMDTLDPTLPSEEIQCGFKKLVRGMFHDCGYNWDGIVLILIVTRMLCETALKCGSIYRISELVEFCVKYFEECGVNRWIFAHGGWEHFDGRRYRKPSVSDSKPTSKAESLSELAKVLLAQRVSRLEEVPSPPPNRWYDEFKILSEYLPPNKKFYKNTEDVVKNIIELESTWMARPEYVQSLEHLSTLVPTDMEHREARRRFKFFLRTRVFGRYKRASQVISCLVHLHFLSAKARKEYNACRVSELIQWCLEVCEEVGADYLINRDGGWEDCRKFSVDADDALFLPSMSLSSQRKKQKRQESWEEIMMSMFFLGGLTFLGYRTYSTITGKDPLKELEKVVQPILNTVEEIVNPEKKEDVLMKFTPESALYDADEVLVTLEPYLGVTEEIIYPEPAPAPTILE